MSWSYTGDPLSSPADECRFLLGDTNPDTPEVQDEEINYALTLAYGTSPPPATGNFLPAAWLADALVGKYARMVDKSVGDLRISYSSLQKNFQAIATRLRMRATLAGVRVYAGGQSISEKFQLASDPDRLGTAAVINGMSYADPVNNEEDESTNTTIP